MSEGLPPIRVTLVDAQGSAALPFYKWFEGVQRAIGTPPDVGSTGTAQNYDVGTQGNKVPLTSGKNIWSGTNVYTKPLNSVTGYKVANVQVVGVQQAAITAPAGGATVDAESRTAIGLILTALQTHGLIDT